MADITKKDALELAIRVIESQPNLFANNPIPIDDKETGRLLAHHTAMIAEYFIKYTEGTIDPEVTG